MKQSWCKVFLINVVINMCFFMLPINLFANTEGIQIYQKNMHLSAEHKQKLAADIYRYHNADNLWDELRQEFVLPHYENVPQVQEQITWFVNHQDFLINSATRAAPYLYFILQQVRKRHLPAEFVLLPIMESSYNPFAYSSMGAAGIWQMMPATASGFGVKQNWWYDGRRDVIASTRAALDYIAYLGSFFDSNWLLVTAAYDTGEGNVLSAIRRNIRDGLNTDYWSLPLAEETRIYIPRLLALATIVSHPEIYPIPFPKVSNAPYLAQVDIGSQIDLNHAAEIAGLSLKKLKQLNPGYNHSAMGPHGPFKLVLPIEHVEQFTENLARSPLSPRINWIRYKIKTHDTLVAIAKRFNTSTLVLRKHNPILAHNLKPGKHLLIPHSPPSLSKTILEAESETTVKNENENSTTPFFIADAKPSYSSIIAKKTDELEQINTIKTSDNSLENFQGKYELQPGDTLYMVRNSDHIKKIAKKFHLTTQTIIAVNHLRKTGHVNPGDTLIIPTHLAELNSDQKYQLSSGDTIYVVRNGEDIEKIARKFHMLPAAIRVANLLETNAVHEGDRLVIPTHLG